MVFVTMGDEKRLDLGTVVLEIGVIWDDVVNAWKGGFRESDAGIEQNNGTVAFDDVGVLTYFAKTSKGVYVNWGIIEHGCYLTLKNTDKEA
jgi:hypothetical protein